MNEITRIHLAKTPYSIELGAKNELEKYLHEIGASMHADEEVLREIEARMVELLAVRGVVADQVIASDDVKALSEQLGDPAVFADDDSEKKANEPAEEKPVKRFMRDIDNGVIGGVCAGMAAYFNIDVILVRLLTAAAFLFSAGTLMLVYLVFWIIAPAAKTTADKLAMAGRPVTLEALKDSVESGEKSVTKSSARKVVQVVFGVFALLAMVGVLIGVLVGGFLGYNAAVWLSDFQVQPWVMGMLGSLFVGGIALTILLGLLAKSAFAWKVGKPIGMAMMAMLAVGLFSIVGISISGAQMSVVGPRDLQRLTKTENVTLPTNIKDIKNVQVIGGNLTYGYATAGKPLTAEVKYLAVHGAKRPEIQAEQQGDTLILTVKDNSGQVDRPIILQGHGYAELTSIITVYGVQPPADLSPVDTLIQ